MKEKIRFSRKFSKIFSLVLVLLMCTPLPVFAKERASTRSIADRTEVYTREDVYGVLTSNLDPNSHGGFYMQDGVLHINVIDENLVTQELYSTTNKINRTLKSLRSSDTNMISAKEFSDATNEIVFDQSVKYSYAELQNAVDNLEPFMEDLDICTIAVLDDKNTIQVGALNIDEDFRNKVSEIVKMDVEDILFFVHSGKFDDMEANIMNNTQQEEIRTSAIVDVQPGAQIQRNDINSYYTNGIGIYDSEFDVHGYITAGHSVSVGDYFKYLYPGKPLMGTVYDVINLSNKDIALINNTTNATRPVLNTQNGKIVLSSASPIVGNKVNVIGSDSGVTSGNIQPVNVSVHHSGQTWSKMIQYSNSTNPGDSGAPVLRVNSNGSYSIVGIHKGTADDLTNAVGTNWDAIYRLGVDLYP